MKHCQKGFTLVELMITMVIFLIVIMAAGNIFSSLLGQFKQQSRIAVSNIEGNIGLQMLRHDIEQAGYGLPWNLGNATYTEAGLVTIPYSTPWIDRNYNDGPPGNPARGSDLGDPSSNPPGAIRFANNVQTEMNNSDVLVLKGLNIGTSDTVQKWTYVVNSGWSTYNFGPPPVAGAAAEAFDNNERVIVVRPDSGTKQRVLMWSTAGIFHANFKTSGTYPSKVYRMDMFQNDPDFPNNSDFLPAPDSSLSYIIYGVMPAPSPYVATTVPRRPFNEAYYYIRRPSDTSMPSKCEPSTGILYKAVLFNSTAVALDASGGTSSVSELPLLDCVADMQIVSGLDTNGDGFIDASSDDINTLTAADIRNQLREVRVYIIAHEGQFDGTYTYTNPNPVTGCTAVDQVCINDVSQFGGLGLIKAFTVPNRNYRWKLYTMVITPLNLR